MLVAVLLAGGGTHAQSTTCIDPTSLVPISFSSKTEPGTCNGIIHHSNLGGLGGRCTRAGAEGLCQQPVPNASTPHDILLHDVARVYRRSTSTIGMSDSVYDTVDLRISNQTEYRGYAPELNGLRAAAGAAGAFGACFGTINLLAPRTRPPVWNEIFTFVQLRFDFINSSTGAPLTMPRTYVTFYDFDHAQGQAITNSKGQVSNFYVKEIMQPGPQIDTWCAHLPRTTLYPRGMPLHLTLLVMLARGRYTSNETEVMTVNASKGWGYLLGPEQLDVLSNKTDVSWPSSPMYIHPAYTHLPRPRTQLSTRALSPTRALVSRAPQFFEHHAWHRTGQPARHVQRHRSAA